MTATLSPYLAAGVISCREVVRATMDLLKIKHVQSSRDNGVGTWVQELGMQYILHRLSPLFIQSSATCSVEGLLHPRYVCLAASVDGQAIPGKVC